MTKKPKTILILGGGSSIAEELIRTRKSEFKFILQTRSESDKLVDIEKIIYDFREENVQDFYRLLENKNIDGLVVLLGKTDFTFFKDLDYNKWINMFNSNIFFPALVIQSLIPLLNKTASIVFMGSVVANDGQIGMTHYSAAKSALKGLVKSLAKELKHKNIRVNLIEPHLIETKNTKSMPEKLKKKYIETNLSGRIGTVKDVSDLISFLLSDESSYINSENIIISGGRDN